MFKKKSSPRVTVAQFSSLIAGNLSLSGDLEFEEGLKVSGKVQGNVRHREGTKSLLALTAEGCIEGNVEVYDALIDGTIIGDLTVANVLELHANARVRGQIRYCQLSMENGAVVDGTLTKIDSNKPPEAAPKAISDQSAERLNNPISPNATKQLAQEKAKLVLTGTPESEVPSP